MKLHKGISSVKIVNRKDKEHYLDPVLPFALTGAEMDVSFITAEIPVSSLFISFVQKDITSNFCKKRNFHLFGIYFIVTSNRLSLKSAGIR